jgi:16S rRNA (guanine1207-N2)-methyltransferase
MQGKIQDSNHYFVARPKSKLKLGLIRTYLRGKPFEFLTSSGVFSRKRLDLGTRLLIESMVLPEEGSVLDVGCGYGAVGIVAAVSKSNLRVIMVDLNERAVWLARQNVTINCAGDVEVRQGHLYEPVKGLSFNCVLSNPPVSAGLKTVKAIIAGAYEHMASRALFQMVIKSKIGRKRLCTILEDTFENANILSRKSGYRVLVSEKQ